MKRDMRTRANKAIARELTLHGDITVLRLKLADRERRIRHAARKLTAWCNDTDQGGLVEAAMALDMRYLLRRPLPRGKRK